MNIDTKVLKGTKTQEHIKRPLKNQIFLHVKYPGEIEDTRDISQHNQGNLQ